MNESLNPEQQLQSILSNTEVKGNLTTGDITQIFKIFVNLDQIPKPQGIPQNIISSSTDKFVGRERDLENLNQQLQRNNQVVIAAVEGMGGVGKTELAIQYSLLNLQLDTYPGGICWIRAREQDIGLQIVNFARTDLDLNPPDDLELPDRVRWCWKRWREGNTLIVLDDVKDYSDIKPYLPPQPSQFKVLITTRLKLDLPSSLYLEVLSELDALELLSQLVGAKKVDQEFDTAKELCQRLGYLPLALQLVGRYAKKRGISLSEELRRLEDKGLGHPSMDVPENDPAWTLDIKRGVEAAFELSWDELKKSEFAQELGCLLSLFALAPIPWSLVESAAVGHDLEELEDARVKLEDLHLLQSENSFQLHQLIQEFLRNKQNHLTNAEEQKSHFCSSIVQIAKTIPETPTQKDINHSAQTIPHLSVAAIEFINYIEHDNFIELFDGLGKFYKGQGLCKESESWYLKCLNFCQDLFADNHPNLATSFHNVARIFQVQGKYEQAEQNYIKAFQIRQILYPSSDIHTDIPRSLNNFIEQNPEVANILNNLDDHLDIAASLNNLGQIYDLKGKYQKAEPYFIKFLAIIKRFYQDLENHPHIAIALNNLAFNYDYQGKDREAEDYYNQALEMKRRLFPSDNPSLAISINNVGAFYDSRGEYLKAEKFYQEALEMKQRLYSEDHPSIALSLNNLGKLYVSHDKNDKYNIARYCYLQAAKINKCVYKQAHLSKAYTFSNLGELYQKYQKYQKSEYYFSKALEMKQRIYDNAKCPEIANELRSIAFLYFQQENYTKAKTTYIKTLDIYEHTLRADHPSIINVKSKLQELNFRMT